MRFKRETLAIAAQVENFIVSYEIARPVAVCARARARVRNFGEGKGRGEGFRAPGLDKSLDLFSSFRMPPPRQFV